MINLKKLIRNTFITLRIDITKNIEYDRLTEKILKKNIQPAFSCVDVGCHKGEILDIFIKAAPKGAHYGFEPIPSYYQALKKNYPHVAILPYALAEKEGEATFNYVKNAPAYSGLKKRSYAIDQPDIEKIPVQIKRLDTVIPTDKTIHVIKIDVEGAELGVLKGAYEVLKRDQPLIIFECGLGASDYYGTTPEAVYSFLCEELPYKLFTLKAFDKNEIALTKKEFIYLYQTNKEYYFVAK